MVESSNAWERAQEAIARAGERSDEVVTPDNAVSPFDASMTTVIPHADVVRRGPPDPDSTQRLPHGRPPAPRRPGDANGWPAPPSGPNGFRHEPPPRPGERSDPSMPRTSPARPAPARPNTAPFPAADHPGNDHPGNDHPGNDRRDAHGTGTPPQGFSSADADARGRRPWWKRIFGR